VEASIVSIGDELLTGDTVNTNSAWLAARLTERGVRVLRILVLPDDFELVAGELKQVPGDVVMVTGGIGATHDDVTREAVSLATGAPLEENAEARAMLDAKGVPPEPARIMSRIPRGAEVIYNEVGEAPGFVVDDRIFVLPGVPAEMKDMFIGIKERFSGQPEEVEEVETRLGESSIVVDVIDELVKRFPQVKVGSYPGTDRVLIRMRSTNPMDLVRARLWLEEKLDAMEAEQGDFEQLRRVKRHTRPDDGGEGDEQP